MSTKLIWEGGALGAWFAYTIVDPGRRAKRKLYATVRPAVDAQGGIAVEAKQLGWVASAGFVVVHFDNFDDAKRHIEAMHALEGN